MFTNAILRTYLEHEFALHISYNTDKTVELQCSPHDGVTHVLVFSIAGNRCM